MAIPEKPLNVAVIGAGILGGAIAWRLALRDVHVALIDKGQPGHGASSHSFAWINAGAKEPTGYHNLNRRSLEMWPLFAADIGDHGDPDSVGLRWGGKVFLGIRPGGSRRAGGQGAAASIVGLPDPYDRRRRTEASGTGAGGWPSGRCRVQPQRRLGGAANGGRCLPASPSGNGL